jgi:hypothetical protein
VAKEMEVDGIVYVRNSSHTNNTPIFKLKEDFADSWSSAWHSHGRGLLYLKTSYKEYRDLEWDPDLTF